MINTPANPEEQSVVLPPAPVLPFTVKASAAQYRKAIGLNRIVAALAISSVFWFKFGFLVWLITVVGLAAFIVIIIYLLTRRSITINNNGVRYKNAFRITKSLKFDEIKSVEVFENYIEPGFGTMPRVILAKKSGGHLFSTIGIFWPYGEVAKLLAVLKDREVELNVYTGVANSSNIAKEFPGLLSFYERHPYWSATFIAIVMLAAIVAGVILFMM